MSIIQAAGSGEVSTGFYKLLLDQSLKFNNDDTQYFTRTPASAGNRKTYTFSAWVKRSSVGSAHTLLSCVNVGTSQTSININGTDNVEVSSSGSGFSAINVSTNAKLRDVSAWYNIVVAVDTEQSTDTNRVKIYINGVDQSGTGYGLAASSYPAEDSEGTLNEARETTIGRFNQSGYFQYFDGYIAEVNFIDGTALDKDSFGETKNNIWIPKDTSGLTFGTNGFHLTFKDDVVSEGFNTVTYSGNGGTQSISGVGFSPGLVWGSARSNAVGGELVDVVRGNDKWIEPYTTDAQASDSSRPDLDADGFTIGNSSGWNNGSYTYVTWCWEAGGTPTATNSAGAGATPTAGSVKINGSNKSDALAGTIPATKLTANTSKGFSIVQFEGTETAGSVAHGLLSAPKFIIAKNIDSAGTEWPVYHDSVNNGGGSYLRLNSTAANTSSSVIWTDTPSSTVVNIGAYEYVNRDTMIMYCFAEVTGYSKIGTWQNNNSNTGTQVTGLGFKPAFIILKNTDNTERWFIQDNTRQPTNLAPPSGKFLVPNANSAEGQNGADTASIDFQDDGFQIKTTNPASGEISFGTRNYIYMAFADTREAAFFKDVSSNGNNFTPVNLDYRDSVPDVPTNNFSTLRICATPQLSGGSFSNGNLKFISNTGGSGRDQNAEAISTILIPKTGKWYAEVRVDPVASFLGVGPDQGSIIGPTTNDTRYAYFYPAGDGGSNGQIYAKTTGTEVTPNYGSPLSVGDILGVYVDMDNSTPRLAFSKNGQWASGSAFNQSNPTDYFSLGDTFFTTDTDNSGQCGFKSARAGSSTSITPIWNFGQDSSFDGNFATDNAQADANGHGSFAYAPPSGALALCSQNLPNAAIIDGTENFNTVLYTGDGASSKSITGVGFSPDWVWAKNRASAYDHALMDSVRGASAAYLSSNNNASESTYGNSYGSLTSFDSDGFSVAEGTDGTYPDAAFNQSSEAYVAWNWLAGTAFSNDASATSVGDTDSEGQVNTKAGFAIIKWTSGGSSVVAHGLGKKPDFIIIKSRDGTENWLVGNSATGFANRTKLNSTDAQGSSSAFSGGVTTTTFTEHIANSSYDKIGYLFANTEGYSKAGSYVGNGNADGPFVYTGFRPAWVMFKRADSADSWFIADNKRNVVNPLSNYLFADLNNAENSSTDRADFLSNGFKVLTANGNQNASGGTYIYLAFADQPFKFSNAR